MCTLAKVRPRHYSWKEGYGSERHAFNLPGITATNPRIRRTIVISRSHGRINPGRDFTASPHSETGPQNDAFAGT